MAEERAEGESGAHAPSSAAAFAALAHASREKADAFLEEQTRLAREQAEVARLQAEDLRREDSLRHWSLIVRHASDVVKVTFELALALLVVAIVAGMTTVVWNAMRDDSLVIEAFAVPPDLAQRGLTGQTVAAQLQDKLSAMQDATNSGRPAKSYANNWDGGIRVMIPETGVSVGDLYRTLAGWLGRQTHITGEVYRTRNGIEITSRSNGAGGTTVAGSEADFDALLQKSAAAIYQRTQPYRYAVYLASIGEGPRAMPLYRVLAANGSREDRLWAHMGISTALEVNDPLRAPDENRKALAIDPDFALAWQNIASEEFWLGRPEQGLRDLRKTISLFESGNAKMTDVARAISLQSAKGREAWATGDFETAMAYYSVAAGLPDYANIAGDSRTQIAQLFALLHEPEASRRAWADIEMPAGPDFDVFYEYPTRIESDSESGDASAVIADTEAVEAAFVQIRSAHPNVRRGIETALARQIWPFTALAKARFGDFAGAHALIDRTPADCYPCLRMRGEIDAAGKNWDGAAYWFARAAGMAPSVPFAYVAWGRVLMARGDLAGAVAKFEAAHARGPHYADPLEMWGEALIAGNRSDLALAKFAAANLYAPHWARLHRKWGEALSYLGRRDEAARQFAMAREHRA